MRNRPDGHDGSPGVPVDAAVVNVPVLLNRCMGSTSVALLLLDKLESQLRADLGRLRESLEQQDAAALARLAHGLKGAAGAVAADGLHSAAAELEQAARAADLPETERRMASLRTEVERCIGVLPAVKAELARPGAAQAGATGEN